MKRNITAPLGLEPGYRKKKIVDILTIGFRRLGGEWDIDAETTGEKPGGSEDIANPLNEEKTLCLS